MKKILITFFVLILSVIVSGVVYVFTFDVNSYKGRIEKVLQDTTGYSVSIQGQMSLSKSLVPTLVVNDIEIKNAEGFSQPLFFKAKTAEVSFDLIAFFKNVINVRKVELSDVDIFLQVNAAGRENWKYIPRIKVSNNNKKETNRPTLSKAAAVTPISQAQIDLITMSSVKASYIDERKQTKDVLLFPTISLSHLVNINGEAIYKNEKFTFSGSVKNLISVITTQRNLNFSMNVQGLKSKTKVSGVCRELMRCSNDITLNIESKGDNLQKTYSFFMPKQEDIPSTSYSVQVAARLLKGQLLLEGNLNLQKDGAAVSFNIEQNLNNNVGKGRLDLDLTKSAIVKSYGLNPFSVQANYHVVLGQMLEIPNISAMFDETDIDGSVRIDLSNKKPFISGTLHSHYFKLDNVLLKENQKSVRAGNGDALFSVKEVNLSWMDKVNANLDISIDNLGAKNLLVRYPVVLSNVQLKDNILDVYLLEGSTFAGGQVVGKFGINAQDMQMPKWNLELVGESLLFNQIKQWNKQLLAGVFNFNVFLNGKGNTQKAILSSLKGQILFSANQVEFLSPVVSDLFAENDTNGTNKAPKDLFVKCAVVNANVHNGIISLDKKAGMETSRFHMLVDGNVNLDKETMDIHFVPQKNSSAHSGYIANVIRGVSLKGRLDDPKPSVEADVSSLLTEFLPNATATEDKFRGKKAVLNAYVNKKTTEDVSVCRVASTGMNFKTVDAYFGRLPVTTEPVKVISKPKEEPEQTKAQKLGRELLNTLSDVLNEQDTNGTVKK